MARQAWATTLYSLVLGSAALFLIVGPFLPFFEARPALLTIEGAVRYALAVWLFLFSGPFVLLLHHYWFDLGYRRPVFALDLLCALTLLLAFLGLGYVSPGIVSPRSSAFLAALLAVLFPVRNHLLQRVGDPHTPAIALAGLLILGFANVASSCLALPLLLIIYLPLPHHWRVQ
jgi:hypothetical protein